MFNINTINQFLMCQSHRVLALMLLSIHAFFIVGDEINDLSRAFFLCSYGLFLIWQPFWRGSEGLSRTSVFILISFAWLAFYFVNWWLAALWLSVLLGLLSGRIFSDQLKSNRIINILAATYLLAMQLLWVVPKLLGVSGDLEAANFTISYLLPLLPIAILFLKNQTTKSIQAPIVDFFYTLIITLIAIIIVLASYAIGSQSPINYLQVLFITFFAVALSLVIISFLWKPRTKFSGIELLMSRYLSSVGMPFEVWVRNISNLCSIESDANGFIEGAMQEMVKLPWVSGVTWLADASTGEAGKKSQHTNHFNFKDLEMTLHSRWEVSPALYVHIKLLTQVIGEFYDAKRREETMRQNAYMQAFYESGSRLTHDIKNILQSVGTLVSAAKETDQKNDAALLKLIRRQLPVLNQRIGAALNKLLAPGVEKKRVEKISAWWKALQQRHRQPHIEFIANQLPPLDINAEVLDSVIDNLISNATEKAKHEPNTQIKVTLYHASASNDDFNIDVSDTGKAIDPSIVKDLFQKHISSQNGMGVGLYHAAHDAEQAGYTLSLANNEAEMVCFRLALNATN